MEFFMVSMVLYVLHVAGMVGVLLLSADIVFNGKFARSNKKKTATILSAFAHTQVLSGLFLFIAKMSEVNHVKIGVKMLLGIIVAALATMYSIKLKEDKNPSSSFIIAVLVISIVITLIAFLWK